MGSVVEVCDDAAAITPSGGLKESVERHGDNTVRGDSSSSRLRFLTMFLNFFSLVRSHLCIASQI